MAETSTHQMAIGLVVSINFRRYSMFMSLAATEGNDPPTVRGACRWMRNGAFGTIDSQCRRVVMVVWRPICGVVPSTTRSKRSGSRRSIGDAAWGGRFDAQNCTPPTRHTRSAVGPDLPCKGHSSVFHSGCKRQKPPVPMGIPPDSRVNMDRNHVGDAVVRLRRRRSPGVSSSEPRIPLMSLSSTSRMRMLKAETGDANRYREGRRPPEQGESSRRGRPNRRRPARIGTTMAAATSGDECARKLGGCCV